MHWIEILSKFEKCFLFSKDYKGNSLRTPMQKTASSIRFAKYYLGYKETI